MSESSGINATLKDWRQGDCVLGEDVHIYFLTKHDPGNDDVTEFNEQKVHGFMVTTQTCDIVREIEKYPFVDVCPIVDVSHDAFQQIQKELRPRYVYLPAFKDKRWVAEWNAESVELEFWFLRDEESGNQSQIVKQVEKWLDSFKPEGRFHAQPEFLVCTYADLTAKDYLLSDRLDLDYLSLPE